jgi:hypothetical protein
MRYGGRAFVEVFQVHQHGGRNPVRRRRLIIEGLLQALQNDSEPIRLEYAGCVTLGLGQARPFGVRVPFLPQELSVRRS